MLLFSDYVYQGYNTVLYEELDPEQKKQVNKWKSGRAEQISSHVIPHGQDRISIPLEGENKQGNVKPHPAVQKHLETHGYKVHDYKEGTATKEGDKRIFKIGKVLNATNADKETQNAFQNDPARSATKSGAKGLHVVISRHPHDVAGMSTNQGWSSCMNMAGGCNRHYLKHDVEQGTHVAYLAHADDKEAKKPIARMALKPFEPEDKSKKTILRAEPRVYGTADSKFEKTVKNWTNKNFPLEKTHYKKNANLYHDAGSRTIINKEVAGESADPKIRREAYNEHNDLSHKDISHGLKDSHHMVRAAAVSHPNASAENISQGLKDPHVTVKKAAIKNKNSTSEHLTAALKDPSASVRKDALDYHTNWTPGVNKNIVKPEHINMAMKDKSAGVREVALGSKHATKEHILAGLKDKNADVVSKALDITNPNMRPGGRAGDRHNSSLASVVTPEHVSHAFHKGLKEGNSNLVSRAIHHPKADAKTVNHVYDHPEKIHWQDHDRTWAQNRAKEYAAENPKLSNENLHKALQDSDTASHAVRNPNLTQHHVDTSFNNHHVHAMAALLKNTGINDLSNKISKHHVENAFNVAIAKKGKKEDDGVSSAKHEILHAITKIHPDKISNEHYEQMANHKDSEVREAALSGRHAPQHIINKLKNDPDKFVRYKAEMAEHRAKS